MPTTLEAFRILASNLVENIDVIPGSTLVKEYVKRSYQHDPFRVALEAFLLFFAFRYLTTKKYQPNSNFVELTEKVLKSRACASI
jgi:serine palmitoyltransferase